MKLSSPYFDGFTESSYQSLKVIVFHAQVVVLVSVLKTIPMLKQSVFVKTDILALFVITSQLLFLILIILIILTMTRCLTIMKVKLSLKASVVLSKEMSNGTFLSNRMEKNQNPIVILTETGYLILLNHHLLINLVMIMN